MAYNSLIGSSFDPSTAFSFSPTGGSGFVPSGGSASSPMSSNMYSSPAGPSMPAPAPAMAQSGMQTSTPAYISPQTQSQGSFLGINTANAQTTGPAPSGITPAPAPLAKPNALPGDAWYGVKQSDVTPALTNFLNGMSAPKTTVNAAGEPTPIGVSGSSTGSPYTGFGVPTPTQTNSGVIGSNLSYADVLKSRNDIMQQWMDAQNKYANDYQSATGAEIKSQFAGDTTDYGTGLANLVKMEASPVLTADQMRAQNFSNMASANAQTLSAIAPMQVSPGNSLVNPATGQSTYQGMGASPSQIMSTAQQMAQLAIQNGSAQYNPDGTINIQPYIQQAQQFYGGGAGAMSGGMGSTGGQPQTGGGISSLPPQIQQYSQSIDVSAGSGSTQKLNFIDAERVPAALQATAQNQAARAGIPYLTDSGSQAVLAAQQILNVADAAEALAIKNLQPGVGGRVSDTLKNWANNYLQFNPELSNFNQLRETAGKATTALAGGVGSGFRMSMPVIDAAVSNMPQAGDNLETAQTKVSALRDLIKNALSPLYPQLGNPINFTGGSSQGSGGSDSLYNW